MQLHTVRRADKTFGNLANHGRNTEGTTMTRKEIEAAYNVVGGRIRSPGKFEGEMVYVVAFWHIAMEGFADRDDGRVFGFDIIKEDKHEYPELKGRRTVKLIEDDNGFVREVS